MSYQSYLKQDLIKSLSGEESDVLYCRGFSKHASDEEVMSLLSEWSIPSAVDLSQRRARGTVWVKYNSLADAQLTQSRLHQRVWMGKSLSMRFELGVDSEGHPILPANRHHTILREIQLIQQRGGGDGDKTPPPLPSSSSSSTTTTTTSSTTKTPRMTPTTTTNDIIRNTHYSSKSLIVGEVEFPFPSGLYLSRLITWCRVLPPQDPLLSLLTDTTAMGSRYSKEVSEAMAMVDSLERGMKMVYGSIYPPPPAPATTTTPTPVRVFVLGDGKKAFCAAACCLYFPKHWVYYSIDPLLEAIEVGEDYNSRSHQMRMKSEDFIIPSWQKTTTTTTSCDQQQQEEDDVEQEEGSGRGISIVVACHSHAPLNEFWSRLKDEKMAIVMPCCANYSDLPNDRPLFSFQDYEVYSAKRTIAIYSQR